VDIVDEYSIHGWLDRSGELRCGAPLCWRPAEDAPDVGGPPPLSKLEMATICDSARGVGSTLRSMGYFGPFGVDAFRWRRADGATRLQVGTDINARWTLHFARGAPELLPPPSSHQEHLAEG
jgi:hypothetical protein